MKHKKAQSFMPGKIVSMAIIFVALFVVAAIAIPPIWDGAKNLFKSFGFNEDRCQETGFSADEYNSQIEASIMAGDIPSAKESTIQFINCFYEDFEELVWISDMPSAYQIAEELCTEGYLKESTKVFNVIVDTTPLETSTSSISDDLTHGQVRNICKDFKTLHESQEFDLDTFSRVYYTLDNVANLDFPVWKFILAEEVYNPDFPERYILEYYQSAYTSTEPHSPEFNYMVSTSKNKIKELYLRTFAKKIRDVVYNCKTTNNCPTYQDMCEETLRDCTREDYSYCYNGEPQIRVTICDKDNIDISSFPDFKSYCIELDPYLNDFLFDGSYGVNSFESDYLSTYNDDGFTLIDIEDDSLARYGIYSEEDYLETYGTVYKLQIFPSDTTQSQHLKCYWGGILDDGYSGLNNKFGLVCTPSNEMDNYFNLRVPSCEDGTIKQISDYMN
jgi:hypothetical protein